MPARWLGLLMIAAGFAGWWYNWHLATTEGYFYIKLCVFGPLGLAGGILMLVNPDWAGPLRSDSTRAHKAALFTVIGFMLAASGIDMYLLKHSRSPAQRTYRLDTYKPPAPQSPARRFEPDLRVIDRGLRGATATP
jgi:hypothetical protein